MCLINVRMKTWKRVLATRSTFASANSGVRTNVLHPGWPGGYTAPSSFSVDTEHSEQRREAKNPQRQALRNANGSVMSETKAPIRDVLDLLARYCHRPGGLLRINRNVHNSPETPCVPV